MPWRYIVFFIVILTAACGASKRLVELREKTGDSQSAEPAVTAPIAGGDTISGSSIAPGGAGGRQS